jgi:hypothetical protein
VTGLVSVPILVVGAMVLPPVLSLAAVVLDAAVTAVTLLAAVRG